MRQHLTLLSILATGLTACSLINSYDDVVSGTQNAGGGATTTSTTTTASGGSGTGGMTGSGGGGGAPPNPIECAVSETFTVEDLKAEVGQDRTYRDRSSGFQPNGGELRVFLLRGQTFRALDIDLGQKQIVGQYESDVLEVSPMRRFGPDAGMFLTRANTGNGFPIDLLVFGGGNIMTPTVQPVSDGSLTPAAVDPPRGVLAPRGPAIGDADLLVRFRTNSGYAAQFVRHDNNVPSTTVTDLRDAGPFPDEEAASPRAIIRTADNMVHAFVGSPQSDMSAGTKQWIFNDMSASSPNAQGLGANGFIMLDGVGAMGMADLAYGHIGPASLELVAAHVAESKLNGLKATDLKSILTLDSFLDVPSAGDSRLDGDAVFLVGPNGTKDKMVLIIGKTAGGTALYQKDLFAPSTDFKFGEVAIFATQAPISSLGGVAYLVYTERSVSVPQYDVLRVAQLGCQKQP